MANLKAEEAYLPIFMLVANASNAKKCFIHAIDDESYMLRGEGSNSTQCNKFNSELIPNDAHYKLPEWHHKEVNWLNVVKEPAKIVKIAWCEDQTLLDEYSGCPDKLRNILHNLRAVERNLDLMRERRSKHEMTKKRTIPSAPYRNRPKERKVEKLEINQMPYMDGIESGQIE